MKIQIGCTKVDLSQCKPKIKKCPVCGNTNTNLGINAYLYFDDDSKAIDFIYVDQAEKFSLYCNGCKSVSTQKPNGQNHLTEQAAAQQQSSAFFCHPAVSAMLREKI